MSDCRQDDYETNDYRIVFEDNACSRDKCGNNKTQKQAEAINEKCLETYYEQKYYYHYYIILINQFKSMKNLTITT